MLEEGVALIFSCESYMLRLSYACSMAFLFAGMLTPISSIFHARCDDPLKSGCRFPFIIMPTVSNSRPSLRIEAKRIPRKDSAKVRNRRILLKYNGSQTKPRLSVFCSTKQLYAMLVDDENKKTLFYSSTLQNTIRGDPPYNTIEAALRVGKAVVEACKELQIHVISSYDRNGFARGERMQAFEVPIAQYGLLTRRSIN